jgi:aconitase A
VSDYRVLRLARPQDEPCRRTHGQIAASDDGKETACTVTCRIDTPVGADYYRNGGILPFVLRQLAG